MKKMILIFFLCFNLLVGCSDDENTVEQEQSIFGTWMLVEEYVVTGVNGEWKKIEGYEFTVELDSSFSSSQFTECREGTVDLDLNNEQLTFKYNCEGFSLGISSPPGTFSYSYIFVDNKLFLHPLFLTCDEGCGFGFKKIAEPAIGE